MIIKMMIIVSLKESTNNGGRSSKYNVNRVHCCCALCALWSVLV
jgi:hypothetical protein